MTSTWRLDAHDPPYDTTLYAGERKLLSNQPYYPVVNLTAEEWRLVAAAPEMRAIIEEVLAACNKADGLYLSELETIMHTLYRVVQQRGSALLAYIDGGVR